MLNNHCATNLINLEGVKFKDIDIQEDRVRVLVTSVHNAQLCPHCCIPTTMLVDITPKTYRDLNIFERPCYIEIDVRRFECRSCFCTFTEPLSFAAPHRRYTD